MLGSIRTLERYLETLERALLVFFLAVMICLSFTQVLLREFFSTGILWADTLLRHLVLWAGFLGACIAAKESKHFVIDAFRKIFPERARYFSALMTNLFSLVCLFFISGAAARFIKDDFSSGSVIFRVGGMTIPAWWLDSIIPAGFMLLFAHFLIRTILDLFPAADQ